MNTQLYSEVNSTLYKKLPQDLIKNVCDMMKKPTPKYKSGQAIYLNKANTGFIEGKPVWNDWTGLDDQWYYTYCYGLGGLSEGRILESMITLKAI